MYRSKRGYTFVFVMLAAVVVLLAAGCASPGASGVEAAKAPPSIVVSGYGEARGVPDMASVQLGISLIDSNIGEVVGEVNRIADAVQAAVIAAGVEEIDIQTTNYNVWPEDRYDPMTGMATGERFFHIDSTIQVIVRDMGKMGNVIDVALDAGANNIYGITFGVEETEALSAEARALAIADAKERAGQLAEGMGVTLGAPLVISEGASQVISVPTMREAAFGIGGGGGGAPISSGQATVSVMVSITYEIVP
jgi:uncharacterized protein YggE